MSTARSKLEKYGLIATMLVLGGAALVLPAWLFEWRTGRALAPPGASGEPEAGAALTRLVDGLAETLELAREHLERGQISPAAQTLDAAARGAAVARYAQPQTALATTRERIARARRALHNGRPARAREDVSEALAALESAAPFATQKQASTDLEPYVGATVIDARGVRIGEVERISGEKLVLALGGGRDVLGLFDLPARELRTLAPAALVLGPTPLFDATLVAWPGAPEHGEATARLGEH